MEVFSFCPRTLNIREVCNKKRLKSFLSDWLTKKRAGLKRTIAAQFQID